VTAAQKVRVQHPIQCCAAPAKCHRASPWISEQPRGRPGKTPANPSQKSLSANINPHGTHLAFITPQRLNDEPQSSIPQVLTNFGQRRPLNLVSHPIRGTP